MIRPTNPTTRLDLEMHLYQAGTSFNGYALFAKDLYDRKTDQCVVDVFLSVLRQAVLAPDMALSCLQLNKSISQSSMQQFIMEGSDGGEDAGSIVDAFTTQARAYPDCIAVEDDTGRLTYAQLHYDTEKLAAWLTKFSLPAETLVAVLSSRSCLTIVAYLAILKANLSYVPLDPKLPSGRIEALLSHNNIRLLLFQMACKFSS
jgi:non-ribosomal peptide synthetase component F